MISMTRMLAGADGAWTCALTEAACSSMAVGSLAGAQQIIDATREALGEAVAHFPPETLSLVVAGASGLPAALVRDLLSQ
jgi:hypothetical protein